MQIQLPWSNPESLDVRSVSGGYLVQGLDQQDMLMSNWEIKVKGSSPKPSDQDLYLAQTIAKSVKSNAIVLVKDGQTVGIGAGQMSRVEAVRIACEKAGGRAQGSILGSDAFFPFADGLEWAAAQGVRAFIHPGGSLRDDEVMGAAQRLGVWLFATGIRHFRH
jgi:phosphoribosylaminoimidazolecarboxamide formyltransferase/IMP cyclohydrolase